MSDPFMGEIKIASFNFPPKGWALCNGQLLPINQNQGLFALLGTSFGGDGRTTFALPNLQGRAPVHIGSGVTLGQVAGEAAHTLAINELPSHNHLVMTDAKTPASNNTNTPSSNTVLGQSGGVSNPGHQDQQPYTVQIYNSPQALTAMAPQSIGQNGGSQPHQNMQPFLVLNFIIALQGIYPSRN